MELDFLWLILAIVIGTYFVLFGFLKRVHEWYHVCKLGQKRHSLPPGDMGLPFLGNMLSFLRAFKPGGDPDTFVKDLVERYGKTGIYKTYLFGTPSIIVCGPDTIKQVYMNDEKFGMGYSKAIRRLAGKRTFLNVENAEHRLLRKLLTGPMTGQEALAMYVNNIEDIITNYLEEWATMDKPIKFLLEMRKVALRGILRMLIGSSSDPIIPSVEGLFADLNNGFHSSGINLPGSIFNRGLKARNKLVKILQAVLDNEREMKKRGQQKAKKGVIDLMMEAEHENEKPLDEDIVDLIIILTFSGNSTPATVTTWLLTYLYQHPEILQKAKEEQEEIVKKRPSTQKGLSFKEIKQMEYLSKVLDEALRIINLPFVTLREAKVDADVKGYTIPKGWKVMIWNRGVHMDPENYPNPNEYDPSRWDNHVPKPGSFVVFGLGSRRCIGSDIAKIEISTFFHHFLLNYKLEEFNLECPTVYLPGSKPSDYLPAKFVKVK